MEDVLRLIEIADQVGLNEKKLWEGFAHAYMLYFKDIRVNESIDLIYLISKHTKL